MKREISVLFLAIGWLASLGQALAGESATIAVSCTIPEIPGVNAPPFPENTITANYSQDSTLEQSSEKESPIVVAEETQIARKTIYTK